MSRPQTRSMRAAAAKFRQNRTRIRGIRSVGAISKRRRDRIFKTLTKRKNSRKAKSFLKKLTVETSIKKKQKLVCDSGASKSLTSFSEEVRIPAMCNFVSPRKSTFISSFNSRTLKAQWN